MFFLPVLLIRGLNGMELYLSCIIILLFILALKLKNITLYDIYFCFIVDQDLHRLNGPLICRL